MSRVLLLVFLCCCLIPFDTQAQYSTDSLLIPKYRVNHWVSGGIAVAGFGLSYWGSVRIEGKDRLTEQALEGLDRMNVPGFDRSALDLNASFARDAEKISDAVLFVNVISPALLYLDDRIRKDWADLLFLYLETQGIGLNLYSWGFPQYMDRIRPSAYYEELSLGRRTDGRNKNSFFSGHVSLGATATFFTAKIFNDYHPEWTYQRYLVYGAALIPPAIVGYYRYRALKHYLSDNIVGMAIGAAAGILIPHFHRNKKRNLGLSLFYEPEGKGMSLLYRF